MRMLANLLSFYSPSERGISTAFGEFSMDCSGIW